MSNRAAADRIEALYRECWESAKAEAPTGTKLRIDYDGDVVTAKWRCGTLKFWQQIPVRFAEQMHGTALRAKIAGQVTDVVREFRRYADNAGGMN